MWGGLDLLAYDYFLMPMEEGFNYFEKFVGNKSSVCLLLLQFRLCFGVFWDNENRV